MSQITRTKRKISDLENIEKKLQTKKLQIEKKIDDTKKQIIQSKNNLYKYEKLEKIEEFRQMRNNPENWQEFLKKYSEFDFADDSSLKHFAPQKYETNKNQINKYFHLTSEELEKIVDICLSNDNLSEIDMNRYKFRFTFPYDYKNIELCQEIRLIAKNICIVYCYVSRENGDQYLSLGVHLQRKGPPLSHRDVFEFLNETIFQ